MTATTALSRFVALHEGAAIPDGALGLARTAFIDVMATTLAGAAEPVGREVTAWVRDAGGALQDEHRAGRARQRDHGARAPV